MNSSRLQLKYTIQSSGFRKETLTGTEYEVFGIISNYGDTVVHPGNAPRPVLIPKSALISLAELRNGRYVVVNHPTYWGQDVPSTYNKSVIESHQIGSWFNNYYDGVRNCIRGEIWIDPLRAASVMSGQEILDRLRLGEKVEVSESNVCFSDPTPGELNGIPYDEVLLIMVPEHIAVLPMGYIGACSNEGGCGAAINMSMKVDNGNGGNQGKGGQPMTISQTAKWIFRSLQGKNERKVNPESKNQMLVSDISALLVDALVAVEPAFYYLRNFDPDKGLVFYCTRIIMGDRWDGATEEKIFMRSYSITGGVVTLGEPAEVIATESYEVVSAINQVNQESSLESNNVEGSEPTTETINETETNHPCSCKGANMSEQTPVVPPSEVESGTPVNPATTGDNNPPATPVVNPSNPPTAPAVPTTPATPSAPAVDPTSVNQASAADWWNSVPPQVRSVLESMASQEAQRFEALVRVAMNQGLPEVMARKCTSAELTTVLEKMGIYSRPGQPITAPLTNEAGQAKQRPSPWSGKAN